MPRKFQPDLDVDHSGRTNGQRAERAHRALTYWRKGEAKDEADLRDLLTDLMHYADEQGVDFEKELNRALSHYYTERGCYRSADSHP